MVDIQKYLKVDPKTKKTIFIGDKMEIFIPTRYETYNLLSVDEQVKVLGIFDITINDTIETGFLLPAPIIMEPSSTESITGEDNMTYMKATLFKNDVFMTNTNVVKNPQLAYVIFKEFVFLGNRPKFIKHDDLATLFLRVEQVNGIDFKVNHVVFELMFGHLFREEGRVNKFYRHTDMKKDPVFLPLRAVSHAATNTSSKLVGSYFSDGINSSLVNYAEENSDLEDLLRL